MKTLQELLSLNIHQAAEYGDTLTIGNQFLDASAAYITEGVARNKGKKYLHIEKLHCLKDGKEHLINFVWSSDGKVKFEDYGKTRRQMDKDFELELETYPANVVSKVNFLFSDFYIQNKLAIVKYLVDGKETLTMRCLLNSGKMLDVLYGEVRPENLTWEALFTKLHEVVENA